jgi:hypothetical protein
VARRSALRYLDATRTQFRGLQKARGEHGAEKTFVVTSRFIGTAGREGGLSVARAIRAPERAGRLTYFAATVDISGYSTARVLPSLPLVILSP